MTVALPTPDQLRAVADQCGLALTDEDVTSFRGLMQGSVDAYNAVGAMPDEVPIVKYPRTPGYRPGPEENPRNAWYRKSTVKGAASGKLKGKVVALKDNIMLAGVPMMNGSATLEGYVPDFDATIVTRMLDAGAEIAGKVHCESFCMSSGSAVVVALGEVDMAIGGDQGGSIRMPSSFSGTYGMKPTWGLVPYTGVMPIEIFVDHTGPMTANVADNALLLEVLAGDDGYDPRIKSRSGSGEAAREPRRHRRRGFDPDAHDSTGGVDTDRRRRHRPDHDVRRRLWSQPFGSLLDVADGFSPRLARAGGLAVGNHKTVPDAWRLHQQQFRSALLRQVREHLPAGDRGL